jgi:hypothetical protein
MGPPSEDAWTLDTTGFLHLPATLTADVVAAAAGLPCPILAAAPLRAHPTLLRCIPEVAGGETLYRLDHPARLLPGGGGGGSQWLNSDKVEDVKRLGYDIVVAAGGSGRTVSARGLRVLWVLDDCDKLGAVTGSHKSSLPPPTPAVAAEMKALVPLALRAGDLLVAAATTLLAWLPDPAASAAGAPRILELVLCLDPQLAAGTAAEQPPSLEQSLTTDRWHFEDDRYLVNPEYYLSEGSRHHFVEPPPPQMPPWFFKLPPEQQAAVGGHAGMAATESDGEVARLKPPRRVALASTREAAERWFFDTHGYIVIPNVMDAEWLAQANAAVDLAMGSDDYNECDRPCSASFVAREHSSWSIVVTPTAGILLICVCHL